MKCKIVTDSMEPIIKVNDLVEVDPLNSNEHLAPFDIIVFWHYDRHLCHFFWKTHTENLTEFVITKSFKYPQWNDIPIPRHQIIGKVRGKKINAFQKCLFLLKKVFS